MTMPQPSSGHAITLLRNGEQFFPALISAIDASVDEVRLETYIFHFDISGESVAHALVRAAARGVRVYLVMDGIGSPPVPPKWAQTFGQAGVSWQCFSPLGRLGLLVPVRWRRLHRKLCVVDGALAFCGGINIVDDRWDMHQGALDSPRLDFAVQVQGPLVREIHQAMLQFWTRLQATKEIEHLAFEQARQTLKQGKVLEVPAESAKKHGTGLRAAFLVRDNVRNRARIERAYCKAIADAREEVLIANAYFLPGRKLRHALVHAAKRGVSVRLLLQGRYESFLQFHAYRPVYGKLLAAGVEIFEYNLGFLHAKVAVIDREWATVGSSNLDPLSLLLAREANVVVQNRPFASHLRTELLRELQTHATPLVAQTHAHRPWTQRCLDHLAFAAVRSFLFLTGNRY